MTEETIFTLFVYIPWLIFICMRFLVCVLTNTIDKIRNVL